VLALRVATEQSK